jgi:Protein kinase domain
MPLPRSIPSRAEGEFLLRILAAVERFEDALKRGESPSLEGVLRGAAGPERVELLCQCLGVEIDYRRRRGESPTPEEYLERFPGDEEVVRGVFHEPASSRATGLLQEPLPAMLGKFVVIARLGRGGQGSAYLARDPDLGHLVVLKRYHASTNDPHAKGAIPDGKALIRLRSRYTPQCYGIERVGDELVLVMEYLPGPNLSEVIASGLPTPRAAAWLVERVAEGLEAVHSCTLVHRDIKPSNIVRGDDGVPRLVDFGLAAHLGSLALQDVSGTPAYMAPEQARGEWMRIDGRTDIYGLGAVLYALLTGQPPHPGVTQEEALDHARRGEVKPPREWNRSIPRPLEAVVLRALAADPARRYATAAELRLALRGYRHRFVRRASIALASVLALALAAGEFQRSIRPAGPTATADATLGPVPAALAGELTVRVWTPGRQGKLGWSVEEPRSLPVLPGELVHLEARLNQPAYAYLLWLDSEGHLSVLYPRQDGKFGSSPGGERPRETLHCPEADDDGIRMKGSAGLETALLLVRRAPLPPDIDLAASIGRLPSSPLRDQFEVAVLGGNEGQPVETRHMVSHRGIESETVKIDDPLVQLMARLRTTWQFEVIKAVRFAYQGE